MLTKQISMFVENKSGRVAHIIGLLAENSINIRAITISETPDFGILRIITDDYEKTVQILNEDNAAFSVAEVLEIVLENRIGFFADILKRFYDNGINVEYFYASMGLGMEESLLMIKVDNPEEAARLLAEFGAKG